MGNHDVQQVCLNGHQTTDNYYRSPEFRRKFCVTCGAETIHKCPECDAEIKGDYHVEGVIALGGPPTPVPTHCENCGKPYPWTKNNKNKPSKTTQTSECSLKYDDKVTVKWLLENVPASLWLKFASLIFVVFTFGLYASSVPIAKNILKKIPGYNVNLVLSKEVQKNIQTQIDSLIAAHNQRLAQLQTQLLEEEKLGGDHNLISSFREYHQNSAQRIRGIMETENDNFQNEIKSLRVFLEE